MALQPGNLMMFDNRRIPHGCCGDDHATGEGHLQGCYADGDSLRSTLSVLARTVKSQVVPKAIR